MAGNLRAELEQVADRYPASYGVVVFHPSSGETVVMNPNRSFVAGSLNKLPVLLTLYRAAARGEVYLDGEITMLASDVQAYGTGVLYRRPVGTTMTLRECAELMITESDNTAWVMLDRYLEGTTSRPNSTVSALARRRIWCPTPLPRATSS